MMLSNRVAIVTGGARGIGGAIALKFADEGCSLVIADLREKEAEQTLEEIAEKDSKGIFIKCDHTDSRQVKDMAEEAVSTFGGIDILVNNAGGFGRPTPLADLTEDEWDKSLSLNLKGVFLCCKEAAPYMMEKHYGKIINISSLAAITAGPPNTHYSASKGGVLSLTFDLSRQLAPYNICVNTILPGIIRTAMWDNSVPSGTSVDDYMQQRADNMIPLQRVGTPDDVANVALFLASYLSDYVTGDRIIVGGGLPFHSS